MIYICMLVWLKTIQGQSQGGLKLKRDICKNKKCVYVKALPENFGYCMFVCVSILM